MRGFFVDVGVAGNDAGMPVVAVVTGPVLAPGFGYNPYVVCGFRGLNYRYTGKGSAIGRRGVNYRDFRRGCLIMVIAGVGEGTGVAARIAAASLTCKKASEV